MRPLTEIEVAWLAGLLEGEGSFSEKRPHRPRITMEMTDEDVVCRAHALTGVGHVYKTSQRRIHHQPAWQWSCIRIADVIDVMMAVRPYMGNRRTAKIDWLLDRYYESPLEKGPHIDRRS